MPIRLVSDRDRDWTIEATELERFINETPDLRARQEVTALALCNCSLPPAQIEAMWRSFFDDAAKTWKKLFGYLPIAKARQQLARGRTMNSLRRK